LAGRVRKPRINGRLVTAGAHGGGTVTLDRKRYTCAGSTSSVRPEPAWRMWKSFGGGAARKGSAHHQPTLPLRERGRKPQHR